MRIWDFLRCHEERILRGTRPPTFTPNQTLQCWKKQLCAAVLCLCVITKIKKKKKKKCG